MKLLMKKNVNKLLMDFFYAAGFNPGSGYPFYMMLEPTNRCNLECPLCPTGSGTLRVPRGYMDWELFKRIAGELAPYLFGACLWGFGEPLLHPRIFDMIRYLEDRDVRSVISTNAQTVTSKETGYKIVDSKLSVLLAALDGASDETYIKYRKKGSFTNVVNAIQYIKEAKADRNSKHPCIVLQFIVMKHNEHEVDEIKRIAGELDVRLLLKSVALTYEDKEYLPEKSNISRFRVQKNRLAEKKGQPGLCPFPWLWCTVNWDGSVVPCCKDPNRKHEIGFVNRDNSFHDVWNSKKYRWFRKTLRTDKRQLKKCKKCVLPGETGIEQIFSRPPKPFRFFKAGISGNI